MRIKLTQGKSVDFAFLLSIVKQLFCKNGSQTKHKKTDIWIFRSRKPCKYIFKIVFNGKLGNLNGSNENPNDFFYVFPTLRKDQEKHANAFLILYQTEPR